MLDVPPVQSSPSSVEPWLLDLLCWCSVFMEEGAHSWSAARLKHHLVSSAQDLLVHLEDA